MPSRPFTSVLKSANRNYADIKSLQVFQPVDGIMAGHLPLEVFLDFRCECREFDRLVPQTNATLRYDKFNRLRLRNNSLRLRISENMDMIDHLLHETVKRGCRSAGKLHSPCFRTCL